MDKPYIFIVKIDMEWHPKQDNWGYAAYWVLINTDLQVLAGEPGTDEWDTAFNSVAEHIEENYGYSLTPYSGGPGRPFRNAPSVRVDEWDGEPVIVITSRFGWDV